LICNILNFKNQTPFIFARPLKGRAFGGMRNLKFNTVKAQKELNSISLPLVLKDVENLHTKYKNAPPKNRAKFMYLANIKVREYNEHLLKTNTEPLNPILYGKLLSTLRNF